MRLILTAFALAGALAGTPATAQQAGGDIMTRVDTDKDGKVSLDEYKALAETRWTRMSNGADKVQVTSGDERTKRAFAGMTLDAGGNLTHAAFIAAQPASFKKADSDGNGSLDAAEMAATLPQRPTAPARAQ